MKISELRVKTIQELKTTLASLHREKMNLRFQKAAKELASIARVRAVRKGIARIETVLNEMKQRGENA